MANASHKYILELVFILTILNIIEVTLPTRDTENVLFPRQADKISKEKLFESFQGPNGLMKLLSHVNANTITSTLRIDGTPNLTASGKTSTTDGLLIGMKSDLSYTTTEIDNTDSYSSCNNASTTNSCETTDEATSNVEDIIARYSCHNLTESQEGEFRCFITHMVYESKPPETTNCTVPQKAATVDIIKSYNCLNDSDIVNSLELYYDLVDVFKKTRRPSSSTVTPTVPMTTTETQEKYSLNEIQQIVSCKNNVTNMNLTMVNKVTQHLQTIVNDNYTRDISTITHIMSHISEVEVTDSNTVEMFTSITTTLIQSYEESTQDEQGVIMPSLLQSMERVLTASIPFENLNLSTPEIDITVAQIETNLSNGDVVTLSSYTSTVVMPVTVFDGLQSRVSVIVYKTVNQKWSVRKGYKKASIGSEVMSVSIQHTKENRTEDVSVNMTGAIIVVLSTKVTKREKDRLCTFWNFQESLWDTEGGTVIGKNTTHTVCKFEHLTNFAVLVLYYEDEPINKRQRRVLNTLTTCGCSLSIACLCVTVIVYIYLRLLSNETVMIHANLSLALLLAQLVLVTSNDAVEHTGPCKAVAAMLHFFFTSSFSWMMVEGLALYFSCTRPMYNKDMHLKYFLIGWGMPAVIVLISLGAQFPNYGDGEDNSCWLSLEDGLIWAFMGPMVAIVLFNVVILVLVIKVFLTLKTNSRKSDAAKLRASLRAMVTLLPILGITWLLGVLVPINDVFHYLFVIGNSMQGMMIFFLHCICNQTVRRKFLEIRRRNSTGLTGSFSDISDGHGVAPKDHQITELRIANRRWRDEHYAWM